MSTSAMEVTQPECWIDNFCGEKIKDLLRGKGTIGREISTKMPLPWRLVLGK